MSVIITEKDLDKIILVGNNILIKPKAFSEKTKSGLFLPPGVQQKEKLYSGYVIKVGPGYPIPSIQDFDEPWRDKSEGVKYVPLQPKRGDLAVYLQNNSWEIVFNNEKYLIVPSSAILMLVRDDTLMSR